MRARALQAALGRVHERPGIGWSFRERLGPRGAQAHPRLRQAPSREQPGLVNLVIAQGSKLRDKGANEGALRIEALPLKYGVINAQGIDARYSRLHL